ncbi:hypothetical protein CASFOL_034485 [Castilleja foliolosa]|uniref:Uncharacterized protein n=1 Tax=Castilleja foliolosa TaxID=1961234 RepID=A0ABD3BPY9_9LAMI
MRTNTLSKPKWVYPKVLEFKDVQSQKTEITSHCARQEDANEQFKHTRSPLKH